MIDAITNFIEGQCRTKTGTFEATITPTVPAFPEAGKSEQRFCFTKVFRWQVPAEQTP